MSTPTHDPHDPNDPVNKPAHYTHSSIECIEAIEAALGTAGFIAYCRGNALKYVWRSEHKQNTIQDLQKAAWYAERAALTLEKFIKANH